MYVYIYVYVDVDVYEYVDVIVGVDVDSRVTTPTHSPSFSSTTELQLRFLCPSDLDQVKELCKEWFPIQYPEVWYRDITSDPRFYSLAAVYQSRLIGLLIAEVKHSETINKEVCMKIEGY